MFTKYLQDVFNCPLVVQMTDDEKFLWKDLQLEECHRLGFENAKDIIACGFDITKTLIFSDLDYVGHMYPNILKIQKAVTYNQVKGIFGFDEPDGQHRQARLPRRAGGAVVPVVVPARLRQRTDVPCLIPCAIDQDPYFRDDARRRAAPRLPQAGAHPLEVLPGAAGRGGGSASDESSAIFCTDTPKQIKEKVNKYAFSGGRETVEDHRRLGGDLAVDVSYQWLTFFQHDDAELKRVGDAYASGAMLSTEISKPRHSPATSRRPAKPRLSA